MNIKYSVLMSIYHREKPVFFAESIESMLRQTVKPDEIVIVKDGPLTLELDQVIDKYLKQYSNLFKIVPLEKNLGLGLALNEGLKNCRNELVARMDTDDISLENRCELQLMEFEKNPDLSICGTLINEFYDTPENIATTRIVPLTHDDIVKFGRRRSPFNHVTVMFKKSDVLSCEGGYHDLYRKEDIDLFVRMMNSGYWGINISKPLVLVRSNKDNFRRRKSWANCKNHIKVVYNFWTRGYSRTLDLVFVVITQVGMFISPIWLFIIISNKVLRAEIKNRV